jgi:Uma2 family endonuclease
VQVKPTRFCVPDLCVVAGPEPEEEIFTQPPFICIEILSKDDRLGELLDKISDYLAFGVRYVWVLDPIRRRAWVHSTSGNHEITDGVLRTEGPEIAVPLAEIFAAL